MVDKLIPPIVKPPNEAELDSNPAVGALEPQNSGDFYFKVPPPDQPITTKSTVVVRLPLYSSDAEEYFAAGGSPKKLSFEEVYKNYDAENFAELLTNQGVLSKGIRYALLYNYFGFPVANLWAGVGSDPSISDISKTRFADEFVRRRVPSRDAEYGKKPILGGGPGPGGQLFLADTPQYGGNEFSYEEFIEDKKAVFVEFAKGLYQLGQIGEIPSFINPQDVDLSQAEFKVLPNLKTDNIATESPDYDPAKEFFSFMHGSYDLGETKASIGVGASFVEPIGVDAESSGLKANSFELLEGFQQQDLRFTGVWGVYTNPIPKSYARAWEPSTKYKKLQYLGAENIGETVVYSDAGGTPLNGLDFTWQQQVGTLDSLSLTLNYHGDPNIQSLWFHYINEYLPTSNSYKKDFEFRNIASMYKLVPSVEDIGSQTGFVLSYRNDPALTLNKIYPRIFKYVRDVVPIFMRPGFLNASDVITPEELAKDTGIQNKSFLRKFRLSDKAIPHDLISKKPVPSYETQELGFTHTIGTFDIKKGSAFTDIINKSAQSLEQKKFRNKVSLNFKTELHKDYLLNPIDGPAVKALPFSGYQAQFLPDPIKPLFDPTDKRYVNKSIADDFEKDTQNTNLSKLYKDYYLSTKLLSYLYSKVPSGFEPSDAGDSPFLPTVFEQNDFIADANGNQDVLLPPTFTPTSGELTTLEEKAIKFGEQGFALLNTEQGLATNFVKATTYSNFALPIWRYDQGTQQNPDNITWKKLVDSEVKKEALKEAIEENPSIEQVVNYGLPEWVRGLRIYPCPDEKIIPTNPKALPGGDQSPLFGTYKADNASIEDVASAALKLVVEPLYDQEGNNVSGEFESYVEIRYAIELDIDERKLILDMIGQGVASLDGTKEQYENAGFDIDELLIKSNGNITSPELLEAYENGDYDFASAIGVDLSQFPSLFGTDVDSKCSIKPPGDVGARADQILSENAQDPYFVTSYICLADLGQPTVGFKASPGRDARNIGYLDDKTLVKVLKEWVNGKGEFNKILITDPNSTHNGKEGFINPRYLKPISPRDGVPEKIFFEQKFPNLSLKGTEVTYMSEMAKALIPTWYRDLDRVYYHREDGEYWTSVTMPVECIVDEQDLNTLKETARRIGLRNILDFYNKQYTDFDLDKLVDTYLVVRADDYHLDSRPGSKVKILVKVGAIYVNSLISKEESIEKLKGEAHRILSLDSRYFQLHLEQALFSLNKIYLDIFSSEFAVLGIDFAKEAERLSFVPTALKQIIATNGFDITKQTDNVINIGFDKNFRVTFISYIEDISETSPSQEEVLDIGFDYFINQEPWTFQNTMSLLYYHRELKNPLLKWQTVVNEWLPNPRPQIVPKQGAPRQDLPSNNCGLSYFELPPFSSIMMGIAERLDQQLDLNPRYDLGSFQFNLLQSFPPCPKPPPGKGTAFFKFLSEIDGQTTVAQNGEFLSALQEEADRIEQYVGDFLSSGAALRDLKSKIFDLDDLYAYVLNYITPETLYSKICKCFIDVIGVDEIGVPNLSINATGGSGGLNLSPSNIASGKKDIFDAKGATFDTNFIDENGNLKKKEAFTEKIPTEDLFCSFCFRIPSIFFRLPTTNLLDVLIDALRAILEFALSQILLELIASLLDALLTCPELNCATGQTRLKDYGAQNIAGLLEEYGNPEEGFSRASDVAINCGLIIDGQTLTEETVESMMLAVSKTLTTSEVLGLFDGSAPRVALESVRDILGGYPNIEAQLSDLGKISDFFACMGTKMDTSLFVDLEEQANSKLTDPVLCDNLAQQAKEQLLQKCGQIPGFDEIANRNLNHDLDKYKELARIIRDNDDLSSQLPPLFSDGQGTQALLSGQKAETADFALKGALETMTISTEADLINKSKELTKGDDGLVKVDPNLKLVLSQPELVSLPSAIFMPKTVKNNLAGLKLPLLGSEELQLDLFFQNLSEGLNFAEAKEKNKLEANLTAGDYVHMNFPEPSTDPDTGKAIYTNNYELEIKSGLGINATIPGDKLGGLSEELKTYLEKFPLETGEGSRPEQAQFFANLLLANLSSINTSEEGPIEIPDNAQSKVLKELMAGDLYYSILSSMIDQMAVKCSQSSLIKEYQIYPYDTILGKAAITSLALTPPITAMAAALDPTVAPPAPPVLLAAAALDFVNDSIPNFFRREVENLDLTEIGSKVGPQTFVDFNYGIELAKQTYDFSKFYDPNSEAIGMPHFSMLEGVVSWTMQLFVGETLAKGIFVLPLFPKQTFFNEVMVQFVLEEFVAWMNSQELEFRYKWYSVITRMIYEKPEFTPEPNSNKPSLPGEFGVGQQSVIDGKIYDTSLGREIDIKSWRDATAYYIRQNFERPLEFLKKRLKDTQLAEHSMDSEVNPLSFIAHKNMKEVHTKNYEVYTGYEYPASSLFVDGIVDEFKNGKFVFQYYFRLEEHDPDHPMYYEDLVNRTLNKIIGDPLGFNPPAPEGVGQDPIINPFDPENDPFLGYNPPEDDGAVVVGEAPGEGAPGAPNGIGPDKSLKGVLNKRALDELWKLMANNDNDLVKGNYGIPYEDQKKPFAEFFKSIKFGVRLCYATVASNEKDENGNFVIDLGSPQSAEIKKLNQNIASTILANAQENPELLDFSVEEKALIVTEKVQNEDSQSVRTSNIFPILSREIDITESKNTPFDIPVAMYSTAAQEFGADIVTQLSTYTSQGEGSTLMQSLMGEMFNSVDLEALYTYSIPISKLVSVLMIYSILGVDTDEGLNSNFNSTKETLKQSFESIYDIKGKNAYAYQPQYIKKRGGPRGIASSSE